MISSCPAQQTCLLGDCPTSPLNTSQNPKVIDDLLFKSQDRTFCVCVFIAEGRLGFMNTFQLLVYSQLSNFKVLLPAPLDDRGKHKPPLDSR